MKKSLALVLSVLALALLAAGCGSSGSGGSGGGGGGGGGQSAGGGGGGGKSVAVTMKDIKFLPHDVTVPVGATITWSNKDSVAHTVTKLSGPGAKFDSGTVNGGQTYKQTFTKPGTIQYHCEIHPGQDGTITVK